MKKWLALLSLLFTITSCSITLPKRTTTDESDSTITIYFARHGKTLLNTADRVQGWIDSPLTAEGREVAKYLGEGLKDIHFNSFYTSDAGRQRETMQILLAQMGIKDAFVNEDKRLREAFFGGYEGGFNNDMAGAAAKVLGLKNAVELMNKMKAGTLTAQDSIDSIAKADSTATTETYIQIKERTQAALHEMVNSALENNENTILAVSSGTSMQIMISDLTDDIDKNKPLANATIVKITYHNGKYTVDEIGSTAYIELGKQRLNQTGM